MKRSLALIEESLLANYIIIINILNNFFNFLIIILRERERATMRKSDDRQTKTGSGKIYPNHFNKVVFTHGLTEERYMQRK